MNALQLDKKKQAARDLHKTIIIGQLVTLEQMNILCWDHLVRIQYKESSFGLGMYRFTNIELKPKYKITAEAEVL